MTPPGETGGVPIKRPGGPLAARPLHFIWIVDGSGSMQGEKVQSLNYAIRSAIPAMRDEAQKNPNARLLVRAVRFADTATWHIPDPTPIERLAWPDIIAAGTTSMGAALSLVAESFDETPENGRGLAPVLVLITDGRPTDDFAEGLAKLLATPLGQGAIRLAIAIGADADRKKLEMFVSDPQRPVLDASNADQLVAFIQFASTVLVKQGSTLRLEPGGKPGFIAEPPDVNPVPEDLVW
jgi:uncharacterized protein YegL